MIQTTLVAILGAILLLQVLISLSLGTKSSACSDQSRGNVMEMSESCSTATESDVEANPRPPLEGMSRRRSSGSDSDDNIPLSGYYKKLKSVVSDDDTCYDYSGYLSDSDSDTTGA